MVWLCFNCKKEVASIETVKCTHCGYRIFFKQRAPIVKKIKAV